MASRAGEAMGGRAFEARRATRGATDSARTPASIRSRGVAMAPDAGWVRAVLGRKLGKYAVRLTEVTLRMRRDRRAMGQPAVHATLSVTATRLGPVVVTARSTTPRAAVGAVVRGCERALRRRIERERARVVGASTRG